jgi:hypothetical protein
MHDISALKDSSMAPSSIPYHSQEQEQTDRRKMKNENRSSARYKHYWYGNKNTKH